MQKLITPALTQWSTAPRDNGGRIMAAEVCDWQDNDTFTDIDSDKE